MLDQQKSHQRDDKLRYAVIFNPSAGGGHAARRKSEIIGSLDQAGLSYSFLVTQAAGDAIQMAAQATAEAFDVVVSTGGDGTANEVLNGLMQASLKGSNLPTLGLIGVGRGSDFTHALGVPAGVQAGVTALLENRRRRIDIGRVPGGLYPQGRYFGNCVGVGFDAMGTIEAAKLPRLGGFLSFFIAVLKTVFLYHQGPRIKLTYDGESLTTQTLMVSVMNGRRLGGGFWMAPGSIPDDGLFDICLVRQVSRRRVFGLVPHFIKGTQDTQPEVMTMRASSIMIEALEGVLPAQTDGEILSTEGQHLNIDLLPKAIEVVIGAP